VTIDTLLARAQPLLARREARWAGYALGTVVAWRIADAALPNGLPFGLVLLGVVLGSLTALTAMGLVLIYRASRVINFAQAEFGGLAAAVAVILVAGVGLPYGLALPLGFLAALLTGVVVHEVVVRRFFTAPRLILTVATIGVAEVVGSGQIALPTFFTQLKPLTTFHSGLPVTFTVGPIVYNGDHVIALVTVPVVLAGLAWFFRRSDTGIAVRAAAESSDRALLLGIPVRRLSLLAWVVAAGLSGIGAMLSAPILGPQVGQPGGPLELLAPLTAAVIARMESLPVAVLASLGIGVFQQGMFWNYPRSSYVDVGLFVVVLLALLLQRRRLSRSDDSGLGDHVAVREVRPVPEVLARLRAVRVTRGTAWIVLAAVLIGVPQALSVSHVTLLAYVAIYGVIAVSLVVLTGWSGQISLGQFAFVGVGAATTASLLVHAHADLFLALLASAAAGAITAALVGIPALRIRGLFLAVTTLAFGVPVSTYLLNSAYFPALTPSSFTRPTLLERFDLNSPLPFYYLCLAVTAFTVWLARNFRHSRAGRVVVAVRDNERGAESYGIEPMRAKLTAFALSGALAGVAGGLYVVGLRGVPFSGFSPESSLVVFTMVVIGGASSLPGALLGAVYVQGVQYFLTGALQLFATGAGLLVLLLVIPGGLGQLLFDGRDAALRWLARRKGLSVPSLAEHLDERAATGAYPREPTTAVTGDGLLSVSGVGAAYGRNPVLHEVNVNVPDGSMLALLGTNGAGKSSLLRVVCGLLPASDGRVFFDGVDITQMDAAQRVRQGLVMMPGGRGVFGGLSVRDNLRLAAWLYRRDERQVAAALDEVYAIFPMLAERPDVLAGQLSGGQQQMLALAQALMCKPRLLMIDELSLGLAPSIVAELTGVVRRINSAGTTVVLVEQSVNVATTLADEAVFMEKGTVRFAGAAADLTRRDDLLRAVFLGRGSTGPAVAAPRAAPDAERVPRLQVTGITRSFGGVHALRDVTLSVDDGSILGIIGSNGAGKTTLFDVCSGFVTPDAGRIRLDGRDLTAVGAAERSVRGLGRTFQDARLFPSMTVTEVLATALERHVDVREPLACTLRLGAVESSETEVAWCVSELLELMGLERYRDAFVSELSTGTRRIVELGAVMAHAPSVLLLDEPSSGIAQREVESLAQVLLRVREATGAAMAIIEHDIPLVSSISDRMVCMHLGEVIATGTPEEVLDHPLVISSYLGTDDTAIARSDVGGRAKANGTRKGAPRGTGTRRNAPSRAATRAEATGGGSSADRTSGDAAASTTGRRKPANDGDVTTAEKKVPAGRTPR